jgi:hypothetical protein
MPQNFSYLSILNPGFPANPATTSVLKGGEFAKVSFLNPPGSTYSTLTITTGGTTYSTVVTVGGSSFANANNVTFGSAGTVVTASASYAHVAPPATSAWSEMGAWVGTGSPGAGVQYSQWLAGSTGYWMWVKIP